MHPELAEDKDMRSTDHVETLRDLVKILLEESKYWVGSTDSGKDC